MNELIVHVGAGTSPVVTGPCCPSGLSLKLFLGSVRELCYAVSELTLIVFCGTFRNFILVLKTYH